MKATEFLAGPYPAEVQETHRILDRALVNLRARDRDLVVMRFLRESSVEELARCLQISEHAVRKRLERAMERLKIQLAKNGLRPSDSVLSAALVAMHSPIGSELAGSISRAAIGTGPINPASAAMLHHVAQKTLLTKFAAVAIVIALGGALAWIIFANWFGQTPSGNLRLSFSLRTFRVPPNVVKAPQIAGYPIAAGWPISLPGSITSTPSVVKLNGRPCIVVTCMARAADPFYYNPKPNYAALVYAFHPDGTVVNGFPVQIMDAVAHQRIANNDLYTEAWFSSPSAIPDRSGNERIALTAPFGRGVRVIDGNGNMKQYAGGNQWNPCSVVSMGLDGAMEIIMGNVLMNVDGGPVAGWPESRKLRGKLDGFGTCIGDASGDGRLETYIMDYHARVAGYDQNGVALPGWPRAANDPSWFAPCMGKIIAGADKEIIGAYGRSVFAWTWDGKPVPHAAGNGVLIRGVDASIATPTLADLDGDGRADIIVYDANRHAVMAWHGDGSAVGNNSDGTLAVLDVPDAKSTHALFSVPWAGVSAADLGHDGVMDLFCGIYWLKFNPKTRQTTITKMLPDPVEMNLNQPTIADLNGDGHAEIILGLRDGRVIVYKTRMTYDAAHADWAICNGNFQHTGVWK